MIFKQQKSKVESFFSLTNTFLQVAQRVGFVLLHQEAIAGINAGHFFILVMPEGRCDVICDLNG
jgi:hypothetical protein